MSKNKIYTGLRTEDITIEPEGVVCSSVETTEKEFTVKTGECDEENINDWSDISFD